MAVLPFDHKISKGEIPPDIPTLAVPSQAPLHVISLSPMLIANANAVLTEAVEELVHQFASVTNTS